MKRELHKYFFVGAQRGIFIACEYTYIYCTYIYRYIKH